MGAAARSKDPAGWMRTGWPSAAIRLCVADEMVKVPADSSLVAVIIHRNITTVCAQKLSMRCQEPGLREVLAKMQGSKAAGQQGERLVERYRGRGTP